MQPRATILLLLLVLPGLAVTGLCGRFALQDWHQLQHAYTHYQAVAASTADLRALHVAQTAQQIHRTNLFADVVWALQGLLLFGLGVVGLCLLPARRPAV